MITVTITEDGQFVDEIQFDAANVVADEGTLTVKRAPFWRALSRL